MFSSNAIISRGRAVADALCNFWRASPPALNLSATEFERIAPLLLGSGAAALVWRRIEQSLNLRQSSSVQPFQEIYQFQTAYAAVREREIAQVFNLLRSEGIEPILIKGWAIARRYPAPGLRPPGDIDLCVRPEQFQAAQRLLQISDARRYHIDLHRGLSKLDAEDIDDLYARSELVKINKIDYVRVLCGEDHLRLLSSHLLGHGACRPIWLCDVAAAVETRPKHFDWQICFSRNRTRANWSACAILLAGELLDLSIENIPVNEAIRQLPRWVVPTILKQWGAGSKPHGSRKAFADYLRRPKGVLKALRTRYPNRIEATASSKVSFDQSPGTPLQIADVFRRTARFLQDK